MCGAHATVRGFLGEIVARAESDRHIIVDMEAGSAPDPRNRRHVSRLVACRAYSRSRKLPHVRARVGRGLPDFVVVANKVRDDAIVRLSRFCRPRNAAGGECRRQRALRRKLAGGAPI